MLIQNKITARADIAMVVINIVWECFFSKDWLLPIKNPKIVNIVVQMDDPIVV